MKPTRAQRAVLEQMATGSRIDVNPRHDFEAWWASDGTPIHRMTFLAILRAGWVQGDGNSLTYMVISDAGRAALAAQHRTTGPTAAAGTGEG